MGRALAHVGVLLLLGTSAHADRITQANNIFSDHCARCHSAEKLRPKTSQQQAPGVVLANKDGRVTQKASGPDPLRDWMTQSHANDAATHCHANRLDPVQRELILSFLRQRQNPRARAWQTPPHAVALNGGAARAPKPREVIRGQGDHR